MPKYKIDWAVIYSATVEAKNEENAIHEAVAKVSPAVSFRRAELVFCTELEEEQDA